MTTTYRDINEFRRECSDDSYLKTHGKKGLIDKEMTTRVSPNISKFYIQNNQKNISYSKKLNKLDHVGLKDSDRIIPEYYVSGQLKPGKILNIDFSHTIKDSIRNLRQLSFSQVQYRNKLTKKELLDIMDEYDSSIAAIIELIGDF
jgi:hypothetical protein